jgi:predicted nucleic acid-binding protein
MIILDTNIVSELMRPTPDPVVKAWLSALGDTPLVTTAITIAEISYGLARLPDGRRRQGLERQFTALAGPQGMLPVLSFDDVAAREAGRLRALREATGVSAHPSDMMIAGLAAVMAALIATRNVKDFSGLPIAIVDPWSA